MRFLFLESFFGGSHRDFAEGWLTHTRHEIDLVTLPARFWKWRMRGAALHFYRQLPSPEVYDGLIVSDLMSLSDLKTLWGFPCPPALVYFHENQMTYPIAPGEAMDVQFGFTDITTALAADRVFFSSQTHLRSFFSALPGFLSKMPEYRPHWVEKAIRLKSDVLYPGCQFPAATAQLPPFDPEPPLIVWCHRWEFDKNPGDFFLAVDGLVEDGIDFRLALLGENFQTVPKPFVAARERYGDRIVQYGYEPSKGKYRQWLRKGAVVISTAHQENFGISVVEAIRHGCLPLLPDRLSYPEIIPKRFHSDFLYRDQADLVRKLRRLLSDLQAYGGKRQKLAEAMGRYAWEECIGPYDNALDALGEVSPENRPPAGRDMGVSVKGG